MNTRKSPRQLDREIADAMSGRRPTTRPRPRVRGHRAHATKAASKSSDKRDINQLAEMFDLPSWDRIDDLNQQHYWEMARGAEDEEAQMEAERAAQEEVYNQWYDAVDRASEQLFEQHGLELEGAGKGKADKRPYEKKIVPTKSWDDAANKIRETINGVGSFEFANLREFLRSGPYTAKQAVLSHLQWIKRYPDVYGSTSARQLYENAW